MDRKALRQHSVIYLWAVTTVWGCAASSGPKDGRLGPTALEEAASAESFADRIRRPSPVTTTTSDDYLPRLSPDGRFVVYVSDRRGNPDLYLRFLPGSGEVGDFPLTFHTARDTYPTISPDGRHVAFVSTRTDSRGDLYVLALRSAEKVPDAIRQRIQKQFGETLA